jgi:hypothetical protein
LRIIAKRINAEESIAMELKHNTKTPRLGVRVEVAIARIRRFVARGRRSTVLPYSTICIFKHKGGVPKAVPAGCRRRQQNKVDAAVQAGGMHPTMRAA